jgi:predicted metal-dependent hydrolase
MVDAITLIRRDVKHARLRVRDTGAVELVVPNKFTERQIEGVLARKENWIAEKKRFFRDHPTPARRLGTHEVPLLGQVFRFVHDPALRKRDEVDSSESVIRSARRLDDQQERQRWYRLYARRYLAARLSHHVEAHRFRIGRLFVLNQRKRWGSCTAKGNITLNWQLITAPEYVIDYVIIHELIHTVEMNHSARFWTKLRTLCPRWEEAITWLNSNRPV